MRPQNHGRRSRNRGNNNRRNQNPLQRSYESNGPDVKIRGNAQVIADKYAALARDAQSAGDRVMAENYLQHAEHYNRIILAAQPEKPKETEGEDAGENADAESSEVVAEDNGAKVEKTKVDIDGPQPEIEGVPAEVFAETAEQPVAKKPRRPRRKKAEASDEEATATAAATDAEVPAAEAVIEEEASHQVAAE
ncbi:MAG: DUF4167 domain-containing protein [Pseudomonadota bacterium]